MNRYLRDFEAHEKKCILINHSKDLVKSLEGARRFFNIFHCNVRSINKNFNETLCLINEFAHEDLCFDIIVFSETWQLGDSTLFNIPGYTLIYNNGNYNQNDGVIIFVRDVYSSELTFNVDSLGEIKYLNVYLKKNRIQISAIYRPHGISIAEFNNDLLSFLENKNEKDYIHFIVGDINIDINQNSEQTQEYLNNLSNNGYMSLINNYTRIQGNSKSCIDHIFVKNPRDLELKNIKSFRYETDITDHFPIIACMPFQKGFRLQPEKPDKFKIDYRKLNIAVSNENWEEVYVEQNTSYAFECFITKLKGHIKDSTSEYSANNNRNKKRQLWITGGLLKSVQTKQKLYNQHRRYPQNEIYEREYKTYKNKLKKLIEETKRKFFVDKINENGKDSKLLWDTVNQYTSRKIQNKMPIAYIEHNNKGIKDKKEIADCFNEYFSELGETMAKNITKPTIYIQPQKINDRTIFLNPTNEFEVSNVIENLKLRKAPGIDGINVETLKAMKKHILKPLVFLLNKMFITGTFPQCLKIGIVKPLYKKGDTHNITNYRPITLISNIAKIAEKIMKHRIIKYLEKFELISKRQFGFKENVSTDDAIFHLTSNIYKKIDENKKVMCVFLDLAKAFDTVDHKTLIERLEELGFRGLALNLFKTYLSNRQQIVDIDNTRSDGRQIKYGVPQGSVLGPVLFSIYINGLLELGNVGGDISSFADDTVILFEGETWEDVRETVERELILIKSWFDKMSLTINYDKTNYIAFSCDKKNIPTYNKIRLHSTTEDIFIKEVNHTKYLGVEIDRHLKWENHIMATVKKLRYILYTFRHLKKILTIVQLKCVYHALVSSHIQYGIISWGGTYYSHLKPLETIQKRFLKTIWEKSNIYSSDQLYKDSKIFDIRQLYVFKLLISLHKNKNTLESISHEHNTRYRRQMKTKTLKVSKTHGQRSGWFLAPHIYRQLPDDIKESKSIHIFKKRLKNWINNKSRIEISYLIELKTTKV